MTTPTEPLPIGGWMQLRMRLPHAIAAFQPGEDHLQVDELHARLVAAHDWPYSLWEPSALLTALDPYGHGVRPGPDGYCRLALVDRHNALLATRS
jgi:hypothetical protein